MNFENSEAKLHPHVYKLREEFLVQTRKVPEKYTQWYCLKEEKLVDYIKSHNLYPFWNLSGPEEIRPFEEENHLLKKLRQIEIENENAAMRAKQRETERIEKEKEKPVKSLENNFSAMNFELKTARKSVVTQNTNPPNPQTFPLRSILAQKGDKTFGALNNNKLQTRKNEVPVIIQTKLDFGDKGKRKKDEERILISSPIQKKIKKN